MIVLDQCEQFPLPGILVKPSVVAAAEREAVAHVMSKLRGAGAGNDVRGVEVGVCAAIGNAASPVVPVQYR